MHRFVCIFGPTGVGKTALIEGLFCAQGERSGDTPSPDDPGPRKLNAEIISADSMQVYRGFDIGTAKPDSRARACPPHHLIDICDPHERYDLGRFVSDADSLIADIAGRGSLPVVSGGTAFYFKHLLLGLPDAPPSDAGVREALEAELARKGSEAMHRRLSEVDPDSAMRIAAGDSYRILRALEVWQVSGRTRSSFSVPATLRPGVDALVIGLYRERPLLYERINARVREMRAAGLGAEVRSLIRAGVDPSAPAMRAIGYREWVEHGLPDEANPADAATVDSVYEAISRNSRRYAKRQLTFFRSLPGVHWVDMGPDHRSEALAAQAVFQLITKFHYCPEDCA